MGLKLSAMDLSGGLSCWEVLWGTRLLERGKRRDLYIDFGMTLSFNTGRE